MSSVAIDFGSGLFKGSSSCTRRESKEATDKLLNNLFEISEILDQIQGTWQSNAPALLKRAKEIRPISSENMPVPLFLAISKVTLSLESFLRRCSPRVDINEECVLVNENKVDMATLERENTAFLIQHKKEYEEKLAKESAKAGKN